jgi:Putative Flp pilus-assembly TadE/G-like
MKSLLTRIRCDSGQAFVFVAVALTAFVGLAALVIDGGSWYQAQRKLQTAADAAALAGAQELPTRQSEALTVALDFAERNYSGIPAPTVTFPDAGTIDVAATATAPGVFARIYGSAFNEVTVKAQAQARVFAPSELKNVAPIAVHRDKACIVTNPDCFGEPVKMTFDELDVTNSKFGLLDLDRDGNAGAGDMKCWIEEGYTEKCGNTNYLPVDVDYPDASGEKNGIKQELEAAAAAEPERELLFPVFDTASATGFHVIGWAAFVIDEVVKWAGQEHVFTGHFVTFIATDVAAGNPITDPDNDFGVHVITLTK